MASWSRTYPLLPSLPCTKRLGFLCASSSPLGAHHWTFEEPGGSSGGWFGLGKNFFSQTSGIFFSVGFFYIRYFHARIFFEISLQDIFFWNHPVHPPPPSSQVKWNISWLSWHDFRIQTDVYLADAPQKVDKIRSSPGLRIRLAFLACLSQKFNYFVFE